MKRSPYSPDNYLAALAAHSTGRPFEGVTTREQAEKAAVDIKARVAAVIGARDLPLLYDAPRVTEEWKRTREGCDITRLSVALGDDLNMLAYLVAPHTAPSSPAPAVVAVCGHGYGVRQILRQDKRGGTRIMNFLDNYQKNFALELAKRGATVLAFEPVAFGEARLQKDLKKPFYISSCGTVSHHALLYGISTAALRVRQAIAAADILLSLPSTDPERLGVMGISGGGLVALYAALSDDRFRRVAVSGYINTYATGILARWHCPDNYIPALATAGDTGDFAAALAPRVLVMESGVRDRLFTVDGSRAAAERIKSVYALFGAENNFYLDIFEGKHRISGEISFGVLTQ